MNKSETGSILHDIDNNRFVLTIDDQQVESKYRMIDSNTIEFYSTFTPKPLRGNGYAGKVVSFALEYARNNNLSVVATCQYVKHKIAKESLHSSDNQTQS